MVAETFRSARVVSVVEAVGGGAVEPGGEDAGVAGAVVLTDAGTVEPDEVVDG